MKKDPYNHKERYFKWKEKNKNGISDVSQANSDIVLNYLHDMECGLNVAATNKKGARSYPQLNNLQSKLIFLMRVFEELYGLENVTNISEQQLFSFFTKMKNREFKKLNGKAYKSTADYVKNFKAFWHWHIKVSKKNGKEIKDITSDLDTSIEKPQWVYLDEEQVRKLADSAKYQYKVLICFLVDTGIRPPSELLNVKVSDVHNNFKELNIRDEMSKTFGRRIKLMLCSDILK